MFSNIVSNLGQQRGDKKDLDKNGFTRLKSLWKASARIILLTFYFLHSAVVGATMSLKFSIKLL